eukprot:5521184-Pyramimonas_sp.AAC.1
MQILAELAAKSGRAYILVLERQRAVDSVNTETTFPALERFGLSEHIRDMITGVCTGRAVE